MIDGRIRPVTLWGAVLLLVTLTPTNAAPAGVPATTSTAAPKTIALPVSHSKNIHAATVASVDEEAVHLTLAGGETLDAELRPSSLFLKDGLLVRPTGLPAGTKVYARTRTRASDGAVSVVLVSDLASAAAIEAYRRKPLTGKVQSQDDKYWVVKPDAPADATPLTIHVTAKTVYRAKGTEATAAAFPIGSSVTVITRGLPSGLLMASIISDTGTDAAQTKAWLKPIYLSGVVVDVQPDRNLLTIAPLKGPRQTIAVTASTRITLRRLPAQLSDVKVGMRAATRLSHQTDSAGHPLALNIGAYDVLPGGRAKQPPIKK